MAGATASSASAASALATTEAIEMLNASIIGRYSEWQKTNIKHKTEQTAGPFRFCGLHRIPHDLQDPNRTQ